ncbi:oxygen-independent coproporphyrinogen III oxidase [Noviherbaspirillum sp. Root189]|uniref:oxygen-independent coproporphyrinogen III oxidase n=1 Tax=Noviherbaspirillum sp. Root189 TaxID=1736487 RepID=UPI000708BFA5|nr:oxygen-independent coproporphyrinogen III oxidase [Noviherbaspirillum sp. Root189]KRB67858.1 coproporphyrinogen III oxidase [Noviherbaspirillum sp. Root189]
MTVSLSAAGGQPSVQFDADLIRKLTQQGPRYTSYPTADRFTDGFRSGDYLQAVSNVRHAGARKPLSLYLHIPFCESLCYYCACNKIITKNHSKAEVYLSYLKREIGMQAELFSGMNHVEQLHFGGGTPTFLSDSQMGTLMDYLHRSFSFAPDADGEYSIEIDPRTVNADRIRSLRNQGFNRLSLGVQDFDEEVQKAVNRIQPEALTLDAIAAAREAGFRSISVDLIYGLPKQNVFSMARTLAKVIAADPDRISVYNYAHMPQLFKSQKLIVDDDLPTPEAKLDMLALCIEKLTQAGYIYIGMDHFAKPNDELAVAQRLGSLHRNFQGYSTHAEAEMVSCGVSAISAVGGTYSQNAKSLEHYYEHIERGQLPITRGVKLSMDDMLRRAVIQRLMCDFELSVRAIETNYPITFSRYFSGELEKLRELEVDGLIVLSDDWVTVTPKGRLLVRNICMVFDRYFGMGHPLKLERMRYSRTI